MVAVDAWLLAKRVSYNQDVKALRDHMSASERERSDAIVQAEQNKLRIAIELAKRQAKFSTKLHLNVSVDSSRCTSRARAHCCARCRCSSGPSDPRPKRLMLHPAIPRGERTVAALSDTKITLDGGTQILSTTSAQLANDSTAIPPARYASASKI